MKTDFLKSLGLDDDVISKIQSESGKDVQAEKDKTKAAADALEAANGKITEYENTIGELKKVDGTGMQQKIAELQKVIDDRKAEDEKAIRDKNISERFDKVTGDKKYLNDFTKNGILDEFRKALDDATNSGKNDADLYESIIKDREGIFESKNPAVNIPGIGGADAEIDVNAARTVMGLSPKQ